MSIGDGVIFYMSFKLYVISLLFLFVSGIVLSLRRVNEMLEGSRASDMEVRTIDCKHNILSGIELVK
jgi:hypothetical protein